MKHKSQQPPQPISHPSTWHDGSDPQTKKKIYIKSLDPTIINNINYYKPCHCITPNEVAENSQRAL